MKTQISITKVTFTVFFALLILSVGNAYAVTGAIFTTDSTCTGVNVNIFTDKGDVYIDGGPAHSGAAGLPPGSYYVQVTEPDGTLLGTSVGAANQTPFVVDANGNAVGCYQLSAILIKASNATPGYDDTSNPGGEYKVWVSMDSTFSESASKTDNFKVKPGLVIPPQGLPSLCVTKFYDANANGTQDPMEPFLPDWKVHISDNISIIRFTPVCLTLDPDTYQVMEFTPNQSNWVSTTVNPVTGIVLNFGDAKTATFGNVCLGAGGGLTLGFWSNKNGQKIETNQDLIFLSGLCLRDAAGNDFNPGSTGALSKWLLAANATNMANMLSAQLTAMELNVRHNFVSGSALVYTGGCGNTGLNNNFITVNDLMAAANAQLCAHPVTTSAADPTNRAIQECLKNALDDANNNKNFIQSKPCDYSFGE